MVGSTIRTPEPTKENQGMIGPFETKYLLGAGLVIAAIITAMFFLKSYLSLAVVLSLWIIIAVVVTILAILGLLLITIISFWKWGKEGFLFAEARKHGIPVYIDAELGSDNADFVLGEKLQPKDVMLKDTESGIKLDPSLFSADAKPMRLPLGLDLYIYSYYNYMPQSIRNHAAFKAIKDYKDRECKDLAFLSDKEFIELVSDPEHFLRQNAQQKINKYFKLVSIEQPDGKSVTKNVRQFHDEKTGQWIEQDIQIDTVIQHISQARNDIAKLPIMGGLLAGNEAFRYNSVPYSSQHLGHAFMLIKERLNEEWSKKMDWIAMATPLLAVGGIIIIIIIIILVMGPGAVGK
jgi:hypothetical protein